MSGVQQLLVVARWVLATAGPCVPGHIHFHVSEAGDDGGPGTLDSPLASLQGARDALRRAGGGGRVTIHSGTHHLSETLRLGPADANTCWEGTVGEVPPRLSGGVPVTGWARADAARVWSAPLPAVFTQADEQPPSSLWVGRQRYQLARLPTPITDPRRVGEYKALQWAMPLDPLNDTAEANKHGVVVESHLLPPSFFEPSRSRRYLTFFHSYDTSFVRLGNASVLKPSFTCHLGSCVRVAMGGNYSTATCGGGCAAPTPDRNDWCCWNREIQGCNSSAMCDTGGEGCVKTGTNTKRYGKVQCNTCSSRHHCFDRKSSSCVKCSAEVQPPPANLTALYFANNSEASEFIGASQVDSNRRFFISNVPEGLSEPDAANQFFVDTATATITIVTAAGVDPTKAEVVAGRLISVVSLTDTSNISWHGLRMAHSDWQGQHSGAWPANDGSSANASGLIEVANSNNVSITSCELAHLGGWALGITGTSRFVTLAQSRVFDSAIGGVYMDQCGGGHPGNHSIVHNLISDGGHVIPQGVGIHISCTPNTTISHNEITGFHGKGIVLRGAPSTYYGAVAERYWQHDLCRAEWQCCEQSTIDHNHIHDLVNGTLSDKAFIQFFGGGGSIEHGRNSLIRRNRFHDLYTFNPGNGAGMYCDAFTTGTIWEENVIFKCGGTGNWYQHWGSRQRVSNNIMVNLPSPWQKQNGHGSDNSIDTWNGGGYFRTDWHNDFEFSRNSELLQSNRRSLLATSLVNAPMR